MADRVAILSLDGRRKRKALLSPAKGNGLQGSNQRHAEAKAASCVGKLQRTDTDTSTDEQLTADNGTQDSVQTAYRFHQQSHPSCVMQQQQPHHHHQQRQGHTGCVQQQQPHHHYHQQQQQQHHHHQPQHQLQQQHAGHDTDGSCGSEVEGPIADDKYIKGTRLVVGGWFQACRGCNEPTAHSAYISKREVPLCPRCQSKYMAMVTGCYPPNSAVGDASVEPLHYWLPRLLAPVARLTPDQRRDFCDMLVLRQDDAWLQLINMS